MIISYTGGAGGFWLRRVIKSSPISHTNKSFHEIPRPNERIKLVHELDPTKFTYLLTGDYYFNFYANMLHKRFYDIDKPDTYEQFLLTCVSTGRFICSFNSIINRTFFNFNDLLYAPDQFLKCVNTAQTNFGFTTMESNTFNLYRQAFMSSCVNIDNVYENFDSMAWVCFVIGQLSLHNILPQGFSISDPANQDRCRQFALDNYHHCQLTKIYNTGTDIQLPINFYPC